jgi:hypothetical protein
MKIIFIFFILYVVTVGFLFGEFGTKWMLILTAMLSIGALALRLRTLEAIKQELKVNKRLMAMAATCAIVLPTLAMLGFKPSTLGAPQMLGALLVVSPAATAFFYLWMRLILVLRAKIKQRFLRMWHNR